jgi:glyoxylase-like metal-dependent hydrolase (beta-lactamase superfamily II)
VDPGPALDAHLDAVEAEVAARGGAGWIALTHDHHDHSEAVEPLRARLGGDVPVARGVVEGAPFGALAVPGHAADHVVFLWEGCGFTGDTVLGEGSVFVSADLHAYLDGLRTLREHGCRVLLPGHGPPITDPAAKLDEYIAHRLDRERRLLEALESGLRSVDELLDSAWSDAPSNLRFAAAVTLGAHLDKLEADGRLPAGVERPARPTWAV